MRWRVHVMIGDSMIRHETHPIAQEMAVAKTKKASKITTFAVALVVSLFGRPARL